MRNGKSYKTHAMQTINWSKALTPEGLPKFEIVENRQPKTTKRTSQGNAARRRQRAKAVRGQR
jgi:hypothetical protein